jgi:hypothetical protein
MVNKISEVRGGRKVEEVRCSNKQSQREVGLTKRWEESRAVENT